MTRNVARLLILGDGCGNPMISGISKGASSEVTTFGDLSRSELMSRIRSRGNATTELRMMVMLRRAKIVGWRRHLPLQGQPDFAWPKCKVALFVDGCFWHGHDCGRNLVPKKNVQRWRDKLAQTSKRDRRATRVLRSMGWKVIRIWECELSTNSEHCIKRIERVIAKAPRERQYSDRVPRQ